MDENLFRCRNCKKLRVKRSGGQRYCSRAACQQARNNAWRRERYDVDPDYRANQRASTKGWLESQGGAAAYYRAYRKRRKEQRRQVEPQRKEEATNAAEPATEQTLASAGTASANRNAKTPQSPVKSGRYRLLPCDTANGNAILVQLSIIPGS